MTFFNDTRCWLTALATGVLGAGLAGPCIADDTFVVYSDEPPADYPLPGYSQVPLNGNVTLSSVDFYEHILAGDPTGASRIPTDFSQVNFWAQFKYVATSGDTYPYEVPMPDFGFGVSSGVLPKGYYRELEFGFKWTDANGNAQEVPYRSSEEYPMARIVVPNVQKIPVYVYADWMNTWSHDPSLMLAHTVNMRTKFRHFDYPVSRLATNLNNNYKDNFGCAGWFQFRFYGFVDGFEKGIEGPEDWARLPPGITVVPSITYCNGPEPPEGVSGCATLNGNRIAIEESEFNLNHRTIQEAVVTLHEIAHTKGLEHVAEIDNLLHETTSSTTVAIREDQCPAISAAKQYVTPDPWEE